MDIKGPRALYLKAALFLVTGGLAAALLIADKPTLRTAALLGVAIWSFARAYYFAFYVIEHYVDPGFRFSGIWGFVRYWWGRGR